MTKRARILLAALAALVVIAVLVVPRILGGGDGRESLGLTEFESRLADGEVTEVKLYDRSNELKGELDDGTRFVVRYPAEYTDELTTSIVEQGLDLPVASQRTNVWEAMLLSIVPLVVVMGVLIFLMIRFYGRTIFGFGRSGAVSADKGQAPVMFADVAGLDEAVEELSEIRDFLADPQRFEAIGAKIPKGVLLYGPPGNGKTLLARAVAGEAGVPFFSMSGSDFVEMFAGVGAARVRDLFKNAKAAGRAIVFVDEIDAVGRQRGAGVGGGHDEREQTLNQLLVELDGFDARAGVILIAATNRPDMLDPALLRPGRFDRQIVVDRPDLEGRKGILRVHGRDKPLADGVDLDVVARRTPGMTGADLANLLNEAALLSARRGFDQIGMPQIEDAIERVIAGPEKKSRVISAREQRVIAFHEAGHALVGHALPTKDPVHKISIIPRGRALGYTLVLPTEDRLLRSRNELEDEMAMLLGGRTAEELVIGDPTTGAHDDIDRATEIARRMVTEFGMSDALGPVRLGTAKDEVFVGRDMGHAPEYSQEVAARIDAEVRRLLDVAHARARTILETHSEVLDRLAAALLEHETLDANAVEALLDGVAKWHGDEPTSARPAAVASSEPPPSGRPLA
ncbi:MAG: ATP-dependent zinc metalloprotease FtsH [Acidimicrobiia bacterium]